MKLKKILIGTFVVLSCVGLTAGVSYIIKEKKSESIKLDTDDLHLRVGSNLLHRRIYFNLQNLYADFSTKLAKKEIASIHSSDESLTDLSFKFTTTRSPKGFLIELSTANSDDGKILVSQTVEETFNYYNCVISFIFDGLYDSNTYELIKPLDSIIIDSLNNEIEIDKYIAFGDIWNN